MNTIIVIIFIIITISILNIIMNIILVIIVSSILSRQTESIRMQAQFPLNPNCLDPKPEATDRVVRNPNLVPCWGKI